jgi:hypothetical protein
MMAFSDYLLADLRAQLSGDFSSRVTLTNGANTQTVSGIFDDKYVFIDPKTSDQILSEDSAVTIAFAGLAVDINNRETVFTISGIDYKPFDWRDNCDGSMTVYLIKR